MKTRWIPNAPEPVAAGVPRERVGVALRQHHDPDPHGRPDDRGTERVTEPDTEPRADDRDADCRAADGRADHDGTDTPADEHASPDRVALGPAKLRDDRRELAHRVARHRDVAEPEALATLEEELAQRRA